MTRQAAPPSKKKRARKPVSTDSFAQRLEGILGQMNALLMLVEADGTLSFWNELAAERLGDPKKNPVGKPFTELIHPRETRRIREALNDIFQEGPPSEEDDPSDIHFRMKGVEGRWVFCIARPHLFKVPDSDDPVCLLNVREDRERRKSEPLQDRVQELEEKVEEKSRQLAESEADYRALIQAMNDGVWVLDPEGRILFVNEKLADLLGYAPSRVTGRNASRLFDERNREIFLKQLHKRQLGRGGTYEIEMTRKDGSRITCLMRASPRFDAEGLNLGSVCNITDISLRKKLEDRLRTSEKDYRDLFENMQDGVCRMATDGKILALNKSGAQALGYEKLSDVLGRKFRGFFENRTDWRRFETELREKGQVEDYILHLRRRDGGPVAVSVNAHMVLDGKGGPVGIDGVFRDVSERIRLESQLQNYAENMEKKNEELESLIYSITHDFKSPLLVVGGLVGRLTKTKSSLVDSKKKEYLDWMQLNVSKMEKMVNDLLVFYRADKTLVPFEPVSIGSVVDTALRDVEPLAREKEVRLRKKGSFPVVNGYRNRLYQVVYNLVENAIKYMDHAADAEVEIGCKSSSDEHLFYIKDNGPGIAPEHRAKIFQIFYTLEPERVSGTGIGLSIVKKIIERHGGRVWVESELGKGTSFYFSLPVTGAV